MIQDKIVNKLKILSYVSLVLRIIDIILVIILPGDGFEAIFVFLILIPLTIIGIILNSISIVKIKKLKKYNLNISLALFSVIIFLLIVQSFLEFLIFDILPIIILIINLVMVYRIIEINKQIDTPSMSTNQPYVQNTQTPGLISEQNINQAQYTGNQMSTQNMNQNNAIIDLNNLTPEQKEQLLIMLLQNNQKN